MGRNGQVFGVFGWKVMGKTHGKKTPGLNMFVDLGESR